MLATILMAALLSGDDVALVHLDPKPAKDPCFLTRHALVAAEVGETMAPPNASIGKFFAAKGGQPLQLVFAADSDGDGVDEIVVLRGSGTKSSGKQTVAVTALPEKIGKKTPKLLTSTKPSILIDALDGTLGALAAGRFDRTGDGIDEMVLVGAPALGIQRVQVRALPLAKNVAPAPVAADLAVPADVAAGPIVGVFGAPLDTNPGDELVLLRDDGVVVTAYRAAMGPGLLPALEPEVKLGEIAASDEFIGAAPALVDGVGLGVLYTRRTPSGFVVETRSWNDVGNSIPESPAMSASFAAGASTLLAAISLTGTGSVVLPPPPPPPPIGWWLTLDMGNNQFFSFIPGSTPGFTPLVFTDDTNTSVTITSIAPGGYEWEYVSFSPAAFTWSLKMDGVGPPATLNLSIPSGQGTLGFHTFGSYWMIFPSDSGPFGTITFPGGAPQPIVNFWFAKKA